MNKKKKKKIEIKARKKKKDTHLIFFLSGTVLDAHNPHTPRSHHTHTHACAAVGTQVFEHQAHSQTHPTYGT
jgi:hypothetical protein